MSLHRKLKDKIKGKILVEVIDDNLWVHITDEIYGTTFKRYIDNFSDKLIHGLTTEYIAYEIVDTYQRFILNRFFK